ncbi:hypothetical protein BJ944DRAFT_287335 [Cunninghamella echinulata]|nr:hypothetical protein BJ944DRAFT_287335 [Cunninghamella echinulata]
MRLSLFAVATLLISQSYQVLANESGEDYELIHGADHEFNQRGQWVNLYKRHGDTCSKYHTVSYGETCSTIVDQYGIRLDELYSWNSQINSHCTNLKPTKKYCVSKNGAALAGGCSKYHKVITGDTCTKVAKKYGLTAGQFYDLNDNINRGKCDNLYLGQQYCVEVNTSSFGSKKSAVQHSKDKKKHEAAKSEKKKQVAKANQQQSQGDEEKGKKDKEETSDSEEKKKVELEESTKAEQKKKEEEKAKKKQEEEAAKAERKKEEEEEEKKKEEAAAKAKKEKEDEDKEGEDDDDKLVDKITNLKQRHRLRRGARLTYYWTAHPEDYDEGGKKVTIKTCSGKSIAKVSEDYADALVMEGSGVVTSSKIVNLGGCSCSSDYECFMELDANEEPYGLTSYGTSLRPFITIAANDIKRDTKIFVPAIQGWDIPGTGKKHNGCLLVNDQSWSFGSNHIDLFVNYKKHYNTLNKEHGITEVDIYEGGDCKLLDFTD